MKNLIEIILILIFLGMTQNSCNSGSAQSEHTYLITPIDSVTETPNRVGISDSISSVEDTTKKTITPTQPDSITKMFIKRDSTLKAIKYTKNMLKKQNKSLDSMIMLKSKKRK